MWPRIPTFTYYIIIQGEDIQVGIQEDIQEDILEDIQEDIQTKWEPDILEDIQLSVCRPIEVRSSDRCRRVSSS